MRKKLKNAVMHIALTSMIGMAFLEVIDHAMVYREWAAEKNADEAPEEKAPDDEGAGAQSGEQEPAPEPPEPPKRPNFPLAG